MNFSHGDYDYHQSVIDNTRKMLAGVQNLSHMGPTSERGVCQPIRMGAPLQLPSTLSVLLTCYHTRTHSFSLQKGPEIRTGNMRNGQDVSLTTFDPLYMMDYDAV